MGQGWDKSVMANSKMSHIIGLYIERLAGQDGLSKHFVAIIRVFGCVETRMVFKV